MIVVPPASRNAPCPCGSGLRYKDCHGNIAAPRTEAPLLRARASYAAGDRVGATRQCKEILAGGGEHPLALQLLAECECEEGRPVAALTLAMRAVRALPQAALPPSEAYVIWSTLTRMFTLALAGLGTSNALAMRDAYQLRFGNRPTERASASRDVGVVLVLPRNASVAEVESTLASIADQAMAPASLVVASVGEMPTNVHACVCARVPHLAFATQVLPQAFDDFASGANAGLAVFSRRWGLVVSSPHTLAHDHVASLVAALDVTAEWGFSACHFESSANLSTSAVAKAAAEGEALQQSIAEADTVGFALINQAFVGIGEGAVIFSLALLEKVGGFRPMAGHEMWDFAMRALWIAEPCFTGAATYRHRVGRGPAGRNAEIAQVRLFHDYYLRACDETQEPPNRFAPSLTRWGPHFLKRIFQTGHVLALDVSTLEALAARVAAAAEGGRPATLTPGVNFVGFAYGEFGLGESLRALARAADAGRIPFIVKDVDQRLRARQADRSIARHVSETLQHRLTLLCLNPDMLEPVRPVLQATRAGGGRTVGYWYWELETIPQAWSAALDAVDEIWCATEFVAEAFRRVTDKPVVRIPLPIELHLSRPYTRADFSLPERRFLFLFTFDFNSFTKRKNPEAAVRAFRAAFPPGRDDVGLVVKSINGSNRPELVAALREVIGGDERIVQMDRFLSRDEAYGLTSVCDAYVSLHRSEGLGLGLAEAMYLGKPVVATAYSGNLEFMHEGNSALVSYRMVPMSPGEYLYYDARFAWAEADVDEAARHMRRLVDDVEWREHLATAGQAEIRTRFTRERTAAALHARLESLGIDVADMGVAPFVSYAQYGEDVLLAQALGSVDQGRYIDVGANDPDVHSVTRAFYDRGWSGVNVEPVPSLHARLTERRARDVNLAVACGSRDGVVTLQEIPGTGLSTTDATLAAQHARRGFEASQRNVPMLALDTIWQRHIDGEVHFLKIDVEGGEADVLAGIDLSLHRPWVIVVEATMPLSNQPSHAAWEDRLVGYRYRLAHDDGLNRYYVAEEHDNLVPAFRGPPAFTVARAAETVARDPSLRDEQRFDPFAVRFLDLNAPEPTLATPVSQLCTEGQFRERLYAHWTRALKEAPVAHRKQWEFVYLLQVLEIAGMLASGRRGLGFGCGREPLAALMASRGCDVLATDLDAATSAGHGWIKTNQHAAGLEDLNDRDICPANVFAKRAQYRPVDMNAIPDDLKDFDFVWSSCAFEHLGSIERGLAFVRRAMQCLRPGGIAVHTTEFNLSSNLRTLESPDLSLFRRQDIERLFRELEAKGHAPAPLNLNPGRGAVDRYVDLPPYRAEPHFKLRLDSYVITSIGFVVRRGGV